MYLGSPWQVIWITPRLSGVEPHKKTQMTTGTQSTCSSLGEIRESSDKCQ